ncbi:MAG: adenosylcobinamide-GDP ribazoletransferase [Ktedonobacteraceae bacterium]|nr:adenosylcobinamide-GDP ribazoletransferase [Ktedonobacteraceae bacterium]
MYRPPDDMYEPPPDDFEDQEPTLRRSRVRSTQRNTQLQQLQRLRAWLQSLAARLSTGLQHARDNLRAKGPLIPNVQRVQGRGMSGGISGGVGAWASAQLREFVAGLRFLTILSVPGSARLFHTDRVETHLPTGSAYFPIIGLLLVVALWLLLLILGPFLPIPALTALLVVALLVLTGGLHLDGLMDTCDGVFGGATREDKLEIMRDSRVGSFGVLGAASILLLKFAFLSSLTARHLAPAIFVALPAARAAVILVAGIFPAARLNGLGAAFRQTVTPPRLLFALITSLIIAVLAGHLAGFIAWLGSLLVAVLIGFGITRSIGGLTGDNYGAILETAEVAALLIIILLRSWL